MVSYLGLIVQFWRENLVNRDDAAWMKSIKGVLVNDEEHVPAAGRNNAGQKFVFWAMTLLLPVLFFSGLVIWEVYFGSATSIPVQRVGLVDPQPGGDRGNPCLGDPCIRGDLGPPFGAGHDPGLCDSGLGLAPSPQMAVATGRRRA